MRKRISKQKDIKIVEQRPFNKQTKTSHRPTPLQTIHLLLNKTQCLQSTLKFEKERIDKIVAGTSIESIKFQQIQKNCCFEQFLKRYHHMQQTRYMFTDLIHKNSLVGGITFMDFKLKNFIIMNNYAHQLRRISCKKDKHDSNLTASRSSTKETKYFKEMEIQIKKMTKRNAGISRKQQHNNGSISFVNLLSKNIQRMRKNNKESNTRNGQEMDFKPILTSKAFMACDDSHNNHERLHTTPQTEGFDAYGLDQFKQKYPRKFEQISLLSHINRNHLPRSKLNTQKSQDTLRYQTEYDTEKIEAKKSKSKKNVISFKKSMSKNKSTSKGKQPSLINALQKQKK